MHPNSWKLLLLVFKTLKDLAYTNRLRRVLGWENFNYLKAQISCDISQSTVSLLNLLRFEGFADLFISLDKIEQ